MIAISASLAAGCKQSLALVTCPPHTLAGLFVDQILTTSLARSRENDLFLVKAVVWNDRRVLLVGLDDGSPLLATGNDLGLGALRRVSRTFGAADVLTVGALLGRVEVSIALVTASTHSHTDRLVHSEDGVIGSCALPLAGFDLEAKTLAELLRSLFEQLRFGKL